MREGCRTIVLDASVGVKWFRLEVGSEAARELRTRHIEGDVLIAVDTLFCYEVLGATARERDAAAAERIWRDLESLGLAVVPLGEELVAAAAAARARYGCSLYDSFSAGLAEILDVPLYSADARAHGAIERVVLIGE